ncbi:inositol-tetrakisphosphate 1-kinase-like isoform 3-T3 [Spinachia spinachia]
MVRKWRRVFFFFLLLNVEKVGREQHDLLPKHATSQIKEFLLSLSVYGSRRRGGGVIPAYWRAAIRKLSHSTSLTAPPPLLLLPSTSLCSTCATGNARLSAINMRGRAERTGAGLRHQTSASLRPTLGSLSRHMSGRRVGFCLSDKKRRRMNLDAFAAFCAGHGVQVVEIDLTRPLAHQGPFDVIVHKLSDVIVEAERDSQSQRVLADFQSYVASHPTTVLLDPLPAMTRLLDRFASYRIMSHLRDSLRADWGICSPPYLEIHGASELPSVHQALMSHGLSFPLICKTRVAHGSLSHEMSLIFGADGLAHVRPPCVLQSFVNHGAVLHKVFVVGDQHFCVQRPSLKNFPAGPCGRKTIFFNSHQVSKPESNSHLTALDEQMPDLPPPSREAVAALVRELRAQLAMALFGVDVIVDERTHTLTAIDINIFPGNAARDEKHRRAPPCTDAPLSPPLSLSRLRGSATVLLLPAQPHPVSVGQAGVCRPPGGQFSRILADRRSRPLSPVTKTPWIGPGLTSRTASIEICYLYVIFDTT